MQPPQVSRFSVITYSLYISVPEVLDLAVVNSDSSIAIPIVQFYVQISAVQESFGGGKPTPIGLYQVWRTQKKKEKHAPQLVPIINGVRLLQAITYVHPGVAELSNLQFQKSNIARGQQLGCFFLKLTIVAQGSDKNYYNIFSKVSLVIGTCAPIH